MVYEVKGKGRIEKCHIDAPQVGRVGHDIIIMSLAQKRTPCKVVHHRVVLDLTQRYDVGQCPLAGVFSAREYSLTYMVQLLPITIMAPMTCPVGSKFYIILQCIVGTIKEIFHVILHNGKSLLLSGSCSHKQQEQ